MKNRLELYIDGACKGNPGIAGIGVVIFQEGKKIKEISESIGKATNNIAEYSALIAGLKACVKLKAECLKIYTDSELVYKQVTGAYKVKNEKLLSLYEKACEYAELFQKVEIQHIPREKNAEADRLASLCLKNKQTKMVAPLFQSSEEESPSSRG